MTGMGGAVTVGIQRGDSRGLVRLLRIARRKPNRKAGCAKACCDQSARCSDPDDQGLHAGSELPLLTGVQCHHGLYNRCDLTANVDSSLRVQPTIRAGDTHFTALVTAPRLSSQTKLAEVPGLSQVVEGVAQFGETKHAIHHRTHQVKFNRLVHGLKHRTRTHVDGF